MLLVYLDGLIEQFLIFFNFPFLQVFDFIAESLADFVGRYSLNNLGKKVPLGSFNFLLIYFIMIKAELVVNSENVDKQD